MSPEKINEHCCEMVADRDMHVFTSSELSGLLLHVLGEDFNALPERTVSAMFLVAASLMRDHVNLIEQDILATRKIYQKR
jgi:hypothetical protein